MRLRREFAILNSRCCETRLCLAIKQEQVLAPWRAIWLRAVRHKLARSEDRNKCMRAGTTTLRETGFYRMKPDL